ncbi:MAG TPA: DNA polymerase III subunit gamma/tau [Candidatus Saccharimonadales bacterium]|nr:DNA polymerase III subunit gamma/tau [Candidatus Saccharimonadales bacterium]
MSQALYRKYRPRSLEEAVGQEHITKTLRYALKEGRLSHAYLLTGPKGVGKTSIARILAYAVNDVPYEDNASALDIIEIDAASNNGVEDIRDLREKVLLAPLKAKYKVYIIDEVHMLSTAAFNALLKTLEEPPAHVIFILATTEVHKLPATIVSRTQRFHFAPIEPAKMVELLKSIAAKEKVAIDDGALRLIADFSGGSGRDAVSLLDQITNSANGQPVTAELIRSVLGLPPQEMVESLLENLLDGQVQEVLSLYELLLAQGVTPTALINQLTRELRSKTPGDSSLYELIDQLIDVPRAYDSQLKLEVVLVTFAAKRSHGDKPSDEPPKPPSGHPVEEKKPTPSKKEAEKKATDKAEVPKVTPKSDAHKEMDEATWNEVMAAAKASSPTLYTVLKQAIPHFDNETYVLTLTYRYPLHQKRLEQARYQKMLTDLLAGVLGLAPRIEMILNRNAVRHIPEPDQIDVSAEKILSDQSTTSTVLGIMGGGETVDV